MPNTHTLARSSHQPLLKTTRPDRLAAMAQLVPEPDRSMLIAVYDRGVPISTVAAMRGIPTWEFRRVLARLLRRLNAPEFALASQPWKLPSERTAAVARACFIEGQSVRAAAASLSLSIHTVVRERACVRALARAAA